MKINEEKFFVYLKTSYTKKDQAILILKIQSVLHPSYRKSVNKN